MTEPQPPKSESEARRLTLEEEKYLIHAGISRDQQSPEKMASMREWWAEYTGPETADKHTGTLYAHEMLALTVIAELAHYAYPVRQQIYSDGGMGLFHLWVDISRALAYGLRGVDHVELEWIGAGAPPAAN
jgi:hypothetical protein